MEASRKVSPGIVIGLVLLIIVGVTFVAVFVVASEPAPPAPTADGPDVEAGVAALLTNADAERGAELVVANQCVNCHIYAAGMAAPGWNGLADRAAERQPPLSAAAYLYESITDPTAYVVEGYAPSMPANFKDVLTPQEIGDIIAHLLTLRSSG
ncbi:MAG: c-type cytochrome [Anaerolineae bacterium]|nr:c-type cytochrome [Anaerolineae bacterium]